MTSVAGTDSGNTIRTVTLPDGRQLRYELTRKRVKNVNFRAKENGVIRVSANPRVPIAEIERFIAERAEFFFNAFGRMKSRAESREVRTDCVRWLGADYPVRVIESSRECAVFEPISARPSDHSARRPSGSPDLSSDRSPVQPSAPDYPEYGECRVFTRHPDEENVAALIRRAAAANFCTLLEELNKEVRAALTEQGLTPPPTRITVKDMSSRWGSNSYTRGHISMNIRLAPYPRETVLSVLWHEYAHYWHHNHSKEFYDFVLRMYPDYYKWNGLLKE